MEVLLFAGEDRGGGGEDGIFVVSCGCRDVSFSVFSEGERGEDGMLIVSCGCGDES
jgi:hypothetical protein